MRPGRQQSQCGPLGEVTPATLNRGDRHDVSNSISASLLSQAGDADDHHAQMQVLFNKVDELLMALRR